jgi:hypothetical protein
VQGIESGHAHEMHIKTRPILIESEQETIVKRYVICHDNGWLTYDWFETIWIPEFDSDEKKSEETNDWIDEILRDAIHGNTIAYNTAYFLQITADNTS